MFTLCVFTPFFVLVGHFGMVRAMVECNVEKHCICVDPTALSGREHTVKSFWLFPAVDFPTAFWETVF